MTHSPSTWGNQDGPGMFCENSMQGCCGNAANATQANFVEPALYCSASESSPAEPAAGRSCEVARRVTGCRRHPGFGCACCAACGQVEASSVEVPERRPIGPTRLHGFPAPIRALHSSAALHSLLLRPILNAPDDCGVKRVHQGKRHFAMDTQADILPKKYVTYRRQRALEGPARMGSCHRCMSGATMRHAMPLMPVAAERCRSITNMPYERFQANACIASLTSRPSL